MGIKQQDLVPLSATGPTALIPTAKDLMVKHFTIARTESTSTLKVVLPADATVLEVSKYAGTNSDAGTSSTFTCTIANNSGTISTGTLDMKTAGTTAGHVAMSNLPNLEPVPLTGDLRISAQVVEAGTVSTAGGPWYFKVVYIR